MRHSPSGPRRRRWSSAPTASWPRSTEPPSGTGQTALAIDNEPSNYTWTGATEPTIDFPPVGSEGAVTQFADDQTIEVTSQDGNAAGTLESYSIGSDGVITGTYSNGDSQALGTIALAQFANPDGLDDIGQTYFTPTVASGKAQLGEPGHERPRHAAGGCGRGLERRPGHRAHRSD